MGKRTEDQWRELIQLHTQSGLTIKAFCIEQKSVSATIGFLLIRR